MSRVISKITIVITHIRGLITPLITTQEPPSTLSKDPGHQLYSNLHLHALLGEHDGLGKAEVPLQGLA